LIFPFKSIEIDQTIIPFLTLNETLETIELKSPKTRIYIQSIPPCHLYANNKIIDLNQRLKDLCVKNSITYIDLYSNFVSGQILNPIYDIGDNIHLNGNGYLLWCSLIKDYINE
jgi:lysophospholipase L1-like esterase